MSKFSLGRLGLFLVSLLGLMSLFSAPAFAAGAPIVTVGEATNKSLNTATLNGTVDPNGGPGTSYKIEYGKTKLYGKSTTVTGVSGAGAVSKVVTGLEPLTTYHFRISATNGYGTTVSSDMIFEMLLSWKVGGKYLTEMSETPNVQHYEAKEPVTIERMIGSKLAKMTCQQSFVEKYALLGSEYNLPFTGCVLIYDGKEQKACAPKDITLHLDANLMPSPTTQKLYLGEECAVGEEIRFDTGVAIGATTAQKEITITPTATNLGGWNINYGPTKWAVGGMYKGLTLGIE
jgi:hypothetical protein